jgi:hypothetical protein
VAISRYFNSKQQAFLDFVLAHYVGVGVDELDQEKLTPLLRLKYLNSISDAIADLGKPEEISKVFVGFQKYLYQSVSEAELPSRGEEALSRRSVCVWSGRSFPSCGTSSGRYTSR